MKNYNLVVMQISILGQPGTDPNYSTLLKRPRRIDSHVAFASAFIIFLHRFQQEFWLVTGH